MLLYITCVSQYTAVLSIKFFINEIILLDSDTYVNYQEIKATLLYGKHMEFVMFAEACEDTEWINPGDARHYGHKIENFGVFNEGTYLITHL